MAVSAMLLTPSLAGKSGGAIYLEDRHMFSFPSIYICIILLTFCCCRGASRSTQRAPESALRGCLLPYGFGWDLGISGLCKELQGKFGR